MVSFIKQGEMMKSEIVKITPEIAKAYLELNTSNRKIRERHVKMLALSMQRGEWILSPQGISISSENVVLDGQHRLFAVVASGVSVPMTVWRDVPPTVFSVIDRGVMRTLADATKLPSRHASILSFFHYLSVGGGRKPTAPEAEALNAVVGGKISELLDYAPKKSRGMSQIGVMAAVVVLAMEGQQNRAFDLYRRLTLSDIEGLPPIVAIVVKQVLSGTFAKSGGEGQMQAFTKILYALDEANADKRYLSYTSEARDASRVRASNLLKGETK